MLTELLALGLVGETVALTALVRTTRHWRHQATRDPLTGALNRIGLRDEWGYARSSHVAMIDLDGFKSLNDTHGHAAGDEVLTYVANRLGMIGPTARLGGDEFVLLVSSTASMGAIVNAVNGPVRLTSGVVVHVNGSVGVTARVGLDIYGALAQADAAMYRAKMLPLGCRIAVYDPAADSRDSVGGGGDPARRRRVRDFDASHGMVGGATGTR